MIKRKISDLIRKQKERLKMKSRKSEKGNVLFLILIAVALFAALSYAVTSSSRSGGENANDESNLISSSTITQYPASVRTAIIRMNVSDGTEIEDLEFNSPAGTGGVADFSDCTSGNAYCVFHPSGGAATFVPASAEVMASGNQTDWIFSSMNEVNNVGTSSGTNDTASATTAEIIAFLPGIKEGVCQKINDELGITGIPTETGIDFTFANSQVNTDGSSAPGIGADGDDGTIGKDVAALDGQAFGCFQQPADTFVYYHVLIEQ
ncbi:MAG: hypothetical protein ACPGRX_02660 [Bdellovibrionales bacterium]